MTRLTLLLIGTILVGCAVREPPTHFYALASTIERPATPLVAPGTVSIGIGPLDFPRALQRPQVVTRRGDNKIDVADFHQWGGRLDDDFMRVLADDLVTLLGSTQIYTYPWESRLRPEFQIRIHVSRFDGELGKKVVLRVRWQLLSRRQRKELLARQSEITEPVHGRDYGAYVAAQSRALGRLAREIASEIQRFSDAAMPTTVP